MNPKVSINLCCYNSKQYLRDTLDSIINQSYKDWELVVINDGSKDTTEAIIYEYINRGYPIIYHYHENKGLSISRNEAIQRSSGKYIAFIDHDDIWLPEKLQKQMEAFEGQKDIDFIYSNYLKMISYRNNKLIQGFKGKQPQGFVFKKFIYNYKVSISTVVVTRKALNTLDMLFDKRLKQIEEYDVFMRLLYTHKVAYVDKILSIYRIHNKMTTISSPEFGPNEYPYLLEKFRFMDPFFDVRYPDIVEYINVKLINYTKAKYLLISGNIREARQCIAHYKWYDIKTILLYIASYFPRSLFVIFYNKLFLSKGRI